MSHKFGLTAISILIGFTGVLFLSTCREKIPEGPPRVPVIEADLYTPFDRIVFPQPTNYENRYLRPTAMEQQDWDYLTDSNVRFRIKVNNIFDETIDGLKWMEVKLTLWSTNYADIRRTMTYQNFNEDTSLIVLHPGKTYYVFTADSLIWDQTDEIGKCIHRTNPYRPFYIKLDSVFDKLSYRWKYFIDTTYFAPVDTVVAFDIPIRLKAQAEVKIFKNYEAIKTNVFNFQIHYIFPQGMSDSHIVPIIPNP